MKKFLSTFLILLFIGNAIFSAEFKKDSNISIESNGLSVDDAYLSSYGQRFDSDQLQFQTKVHLNLDGVKGYSVKDEKVFIGCSMQVFDKTGHAILDEADLFPGENGLDRNTAGNLFLSLIVGTPMKLGETYFWKVKIWDKVGKGQIKTELKFRVVETANKVGLILKPKGLKVRSVFVTNANGALQSNKVSYSEKLKLNFYDLDGFSKKEGKVFVGGSMVISDSNGKVILQYTDLFADYDQTGVDAAATEKLNLSLIIGDPLKKGETYNWMARIWDKVGKGEVKIEAKLQVED